MNFRRGNTWSRPQTKEQRKKSPPSGCGPASRITPQGGVRGFFHVASGTVYCTSYRALQATTWGSCNLYSRRKFYLALLTKCSLYYVKYHKTLKLNYAITWLYLLLSENVGEKKSRTRTSPITLVEIATTLEEAAPLHWYKSHGKFLDLYRGTKTMTLWEPTAVRARIVSLPVCCFRRFRFRS